MSRCQKQTDPRFIVHGTGALPSRSARPDQPGEKRSDFRLKRLFQPLALLFVASCCLLSSTFGQTFVTEWRAPEGAFGPTGMALSTEAGVTYLYVSDQPRGRVVKFNTATGAIVGTFGQTGTGNGEFNSPYGIARDPVSGDFYVAERANHRISRITSSGAFVMSWGALGTAQGQFNEPIGVAVDAVGDVYVTDHSNHRVQKFHVTQTAGVWSAANVAMWGTQGSGNGQFNQPYGITADASGNIWVADGFNGRVQKFNASGVYQATLGSAGTAPGQFVVATSVGLDPNGDVLVTSTNSNPQDGALADANSQWVSRFTSAGVFVSRWGGTYGPGPGQFRLPFTVVVGPSNRAYVADYYNTRVQIFDLNTSGGTDTTAPTVASFTTGATTANSVTFQITFSEPVTGMNSTDFTAVTAGGAAATIGTVAGTGASYTVPVTFTGSGTVQLNLNGSGTGIIDAANNAIVAGATGPVYTIPVPGGTDVTPPTIASFAVGTTTANTINFLLTFSEAVTGVNSADFTAVTAGGASATIGTVTGSGASYTIPVTFSGPGTVRLNLNASGTGIADAANNAIAAGATGPLFTIPTPDTTTGTHVVSVTPPPNGTYAKNQQLTFTVHFSGNVTVADGSSAAPKNNNSGKSGDDEDDEDDDSSAFFTWTAVAPTGQSGDSGKVQYVSGSGTNALIFRLKVHNGDMALAGIRLGTTIQLESGAVIRDANGAVLDAARLTLPWTQNPLAGVILNAPKPGNGNGGSGNNGNGGSGNNGNGKGRSDRLVNLSSRLRVTGGDASRSVVAGFVVTGQAAKQVLIRAVGPGLAGFGVRDALAQPVLTLRDSTGRVVAENDGWKNSTDISSAADRVGAFKLGPASRDAALLVTLAPGAYTAQVSANGNGIVLIEVYDTVSGTELVTELIVNISTRGFVGTGDDVVVAGFVVTGNAPKRVLIRGVGPALSAFGVPGTLQDPVLKLYAANGTNPIAQNDNWEAPQPIGAQPATTAAEITAASTAAGAFPLAAGGKDAAMVVSLAPGSYTAVVSGANNGTGAGLVEVYELP